MTQGTEMFQADRILIKGKIITVDPNDRVVEAVAIKDGKFLATGSTLEIRGYAGPGTEVIDLAGQTVLPGIIDSHTHPSEAAARLLEIDCRQPHVKGVNDILKLIENRALELEPGEWVRGTNFNDAKLDEKRHITREELDQVAPRNPVFIVSDTGHQSLVNSAALDLAGVTSQTPDPSGGQIERKPAGEATGLLYETAMEVVGKVVPPYTVEEIKTSLKDVFNQFSEWGITTTHDASGYDVSIRAYQEFLQEGIRQVRMNLMVIAHPEFQPELDLLQSMLTVGIESGFGNQWLKVMSLKIMGDGSGAGGTAAVYTPQFRGTKDLGMMMTAPEQIEVLVKKAHNARIRCSIHSIGDRGIDLALDAIEKAQREMPLADMRHRLEHNSCCTPKQLQRIKDLGVIPSSSIGYMYELGDQYAENFGPERSRWLHPHRTMQTMGIRAGGNSDYPVVAYGPFVQMYAAVTRKTASGQVVGPEEAIDIMNAIRVYTYNGAYIGKDEGLIGSIEPGKLADLIVIDRDITQIPPEEIKETQALTTIAGGKTVYQR